jgi:hypothetical protein
MNSFWPPRGKDLAHRPVPAAVLGDHRRFPGCRFLITCALCGWAKGYNPERVLTRLHQLRAGGYATPVGELARRVAWPCPGCGRVKWRSELAWPPGFDEREARRLASLYRN